MQIAKRSLTRKNFKWKEFFISETADRLKIKNYTDDQEVLANLMVVADKIQEIRDLLGHPIRINSAYRCLELNRELGSNDNSQHVKGQAVDFICPDFGDSEKIIRYIKEKNIEIDQCLNEGSWIHLSIKREHDKYSKNRNQFAHFKNGIFTLIA